MGGGYFKACFSFVARGDNAVTGVAMGCGLNCSQTRAGRVRGSTFVRLGAAVEGRVYRSVLCTYMYAIPPIKLSQCFIRLSFKSLNHCKIMEQT